MCWCEPIIAFENPTEGFGGLAVVLVQANNLLKTAGGVPCGEEH